MPGTNNNSYADYDDDRPPSTEHADADTDSPKQKKHDGKKEDQSRDGNKRGWFGGIFTKLSLRPPNQMILPDDKNPSIVWDEQKKRWRNVDGDGDEPDHPPPPPPKMADIAAHLIRSSSPPLQTSAQTAAPPSAPVSNIFKMQKGRHIKKSYVDVFNPSGAATRALPPAAEVLPPAPPPAPPTYFVPTPQHTTQTIHVSIPPSPISTPSSLTPTPDEGIYDPSQMPNAEDQYRSGI